jgi:hypothetical protein
MLEMIDKLMIDRWTKNFGKEMINDWMKESKKELIDRWTKELENQSEIMKQKYANRMITEEEYEEWLSFEESEMCDLESQLLELEEG